MKKYIFLALLLAVVLAGTVSAQTAMDLDTQIARLRSQIADLTKQLNQLLEQKKGTVCHDFTRYLTVGNKGEDVKALRQMIRAEGIELGSEGETIDTFDTTTQKAVMKLQTKWGIPPTGYVGPMTRAKLNEVYKCKTAKVFITPTALANAKVGESYNQSLKAHGLTGSEDWKIINGALPPGLGLVELMGNKCVPPPGGGCTGNVYPVGATVSGTPTKPGTYNFTVQATNGTQTATQSYTLVVKGDELITVLAPNGGETWETYTTQDIKWTYKGATKTDKVDLYLDEEPQGCPGNSLCPIANPDHYVLDKNIAARDTYHWIVGTDIANEIIPDGKYRVRVCKAGTQDCDDSLNFFTIKNISIAEVKSSGGFCAGPCFEPVFSIQPNGDWRYLVGTSTSRKGKITNAQLSALTSEITKTNFAAIKTKKFTGTCPTAADAPEKTYTFRLGSINETIPECTYDIPANHPLFTLVDDLRVGPVGFGGEE